MFCRFGSDEDSRPVDVTVSLNDVCTRPSENCRAMAGNASM